MDDEQKKKWENLYHKVNNMVYTMGLDGEMNAQQTEVEEVMAALFEIDGGSYNEKFKI
jgi:glutathionyl-hydroquinone reductase